MNDEDKTPPENLETTRDSEPETGSAQRIGNYRILQKVGEGGMGEVYEAEQEKPVRRRVALKVIKHGMDTKQVVARFEAERQALAMMDHPSVAKVFEAGATPRGRPYFVMEFVRGVPITEHCDRQRLSVRERLKLFLQVCEGVQHAHQNAIIHRDLKPSNVLVSIQEGRALPKIIDFGVAKATTQKLTEKTMFTELGVLIGTPEYMSPEQAEGTGQSVDTRTDVYSLGVMLYELLVGALPFDARELRSGGYEGIRKKIREEEPPKPSTRLGTLGNASTESAKSRRVDLSSLQRQLRGDVDWITMRALEKDRTRRYGSPQELAADIGRHLSDEPVLASPPGAAYRARKFVRRHRMGVGVAAAGVLVLIAFAGTMAVQAGRIARERDKVKLEAETLKQVSEFLVGLFEVSDPGEARGNTITAREILDTGARDIDQLSDQPRVQARLMGTMGHVYQQLGLYSQARPLLENALSIRQGELDENHVEVAQSLSDLGWLLHHQGHEAEAAKLHEQALAIRERILGPEHVDTGWSAYFLGDFERALGIFQKESSRDVVGESWCLNDLGNIASAEGDFAAARQYFERALRIKQYLLPPDHWDLAVTMDNVGLTLVDLGEYSDAKQYHQRALAISTKVLGREHPITIRSIYNLACVAALQGEKTTALDLLRQAAELLRTAEVGTGPDPGQDPDFASLHGDPEFEAIVAEINKRIGEDAESRRAQ